MDDLEDDISSLTTSFYLEAQKKSEEGFNIKKIHESLFVPFTIYGFNKIDIFPIIDFEDEIDPMSVTVFYQEPSCPHANKYVSFNFQGGKKFWVCPDCKEDLGDA